MLLCIGQLSLQQTYFLLRDGQLLKRSVLGGVKVGGPAAASLCELTKRAIILIY